ncbi:extensin-like [Cyprinus carpio]|uniref:Extensin-like n=1 Tax=Cyprinus carpio TaxID=7962 RepID=A0A9Q9YSW0_CYPCA|nr:extensin-like [Cyprinus carpio]
MNTDLPVNHIVLMGQPDPSAVVQSISSVMYMLPAPPPLPNYSPVPTIPPPAYDQVSAAPPPNYSPVPSAPPPAYECEDSQTRR